MEDDALPTGMFEQAGGADLARAHFTCARPQANLSILHPHAGRNTLIDRLLNSPHYGEQWGRHWLDVIRFGESKGYEQNHLLTNLWPFRDYVINSFNADKPFDRFIQEHFFADARPACTVVQVARFIEADWLVEVEADAVVES